MKRLNKKQVADVMEKISHIAEDGYKDGSSVHQGYLYHPIPFPEFSEVPVHKQNCYEEIEQIKEELKGEEVYTLLDIGSSVGFYSFSLRKNFQEILGIEADTAACEVAKALAEHKELSNVQFINAHFTTESAQSLNTYPYDVVLMLNVHMWIEKQLGEDETKKLMKALCDNCGILFFQTASKESHGMYTVDYLKNRDDIKKYLEEAGFTDVTLITTNDHDGAPRHHFKAYGKKYKKA